jgi:hypothetical protein
LYCEADVGEPKFGDPEIVRFGNRGFLLESPGLKSWRTEQLG